MASRVGIASAVRAEDAPMLDAPMAEGVICKQLFFTTSSGNVILLHVEPNDSISTVKAKIQDQEIIPQAEQRLIIADEQLEDHMQLASYNTHDLEMMCGYLELKGHIRVEVIVNDDRTILLDLESTDNFHELMAKIADKVGIPRHLLHLLNLFYSGKHTHTQLRLKCTVSPSSASSSSEV